MSGRPSLAAIVGALGGEVYAGGTRANVPAPGHGAADRSVSLLLAGDRLVIHGFGSTDWRAVRADLIARGLVDAEGRLCPGGAGNRSAGSGPPRLTRADRQACARRLWDRAGPIAGTLAERHARLRGVLRPLPDALRHLSAAPVQAYAGRGPFRPALVAAVRDASGDLCAVELTHLAADAQRAGLRIPRKTIGVAPAGHAVRLDPPGESLLVAEGVFSALSASERFGLPAWALRSIGNLRAWSPPPQVRSVLVAADAGVAGVEAAAALSRRLRSAGVAASVRSPPGPFGDWNEAAAWEEEEGPGGSGVADGWSGPPP